MFNELEPSQRDPVSGPAASRAFTVATPQQVDIPPPLEAGGMGLLEYWHMVRRHKAAVVLATCIGGILGFLLTLGSTRVYQASTTLEIQGMNQEFMDVGKVNPVTETTGYDSDVMTQVGILQSRALIESVRVKLEKQPPGEELSPSNRLGAWRRSFGLGGQSQQDLWSEALGTAAQNVRVRRAGSNRIVEVACDSTSPRLATDFCNTLAKEYIDQSLESRWKTTEYTGHWLAKQLDDLKVKLEQQQEAMSTYARQTGLVFSTERGSIDESQLADLEKELSSARADRITKQSKYEMASGSPMGALPDVLDDKALSDSQAQLTELRSKLAQLQITFTPSHAEVRKVQAQVEAIEGSLDGTRANILTRIRKEYEGAQRRESLLETTYSTQAHRISAKAEEIAHFSLLKREVDATRTMYESLLQRLKEASIASALRASNVRVVDAAQLPQVPYKPNTRQRALAGLLLGCVAGIALSVFREKADRTLQDPGDISYYLGLPELGVVPLQSADDSKGQKAPRKSLGTLTLSSGSAQGEESVELASWTQRQSLLSEAFRTTLTSILFTRGHTARPRVLVLTSASPQEGKTTVVSNLAISIAEIKGRVLVIDADMRRPRMHKVFNAPNDFGLSDLLKQRGSLAGSELERACVATAVPGLFVLPSGASRSHASSLLHSERTIELLALARQQFDTVILDTPPMVNIADARVLARLADGLILVVRSGSTTRDAAALAISRLAEDGTPVLGTILNGWNPDTPGYGYYRHYYQGYREHYGDGGGPDDPDAGRDAALPSSAKDEAIDLPVAAAPPTGRPDGWTPKPSFLRTRPEPPSQPIAMAPLSPTAPGLRESRAAAMERWLGDQRGNA